MIVTMIIIMKIINDYDCDNNHKNKKDKENDDDDGKVIPSRTKRSSQRCFHVSLREVPKA